jgi:hypothetical protein
MEADEIVHFVTGEPVARLSRANAGLVQRDARKAQRAREVLRAIAPDDLLNRVRRAGELYMNAELPLGAAVERGQLPFGRGYRPSAEERLIREFIVQLKRGALAPPYFRQKYDVDVLDRFRPQLASLEESGYLSERTPDRIALTRDGLLSVDVLLRRFFLPEHADLRYT